jgi:hypothetical protein
MIADVRKMKKDEGQQILFLEGGVKGGFLSIISSSTSHLFSVHFVPMQ